MLRNTHDCMQDNAEDEEDEEIDEVCVHHVAIETGSSLLCCCTMMHIDKPPSGNRGTATETGHCSSKVRRGRPNAQGANGQSAAQLDSPY